MKNHKAILLEKPGDFKTENTVLTLCETVFSALANTFDTSLLKPSKNSMGKLSETVHIHISEVELICLYTDQALLLLR